MMKLSDIQKQLKEPFPPELHKERDLPGGGKWFYVPWQAIRDRLDDICPDWEVEYTDPVQFDELCTIRCTLKICGVSRSAPGNAPMKLLSREGKDMSRGSPIERAIADAFKNAAEAFGIGAYLDEQSADKREFMLKYMQKAGDGRAYKAAHENGWIQGGNLPRGHEKVKARMDAEDRSRPKLVISANQAKRLWVIAKNDGKFTEEGLARLLADQGFESVEKVTTDQYSALCKLVENPETGARYNQGMESQSTKPITKTSAPATKPLSVQRVNSAMRTYNLSAADVKKLLGDNLYPEDVYQLDSEQVENLLTWMRCEADLRASNAVAQGSPTLA